MMCDNLDEPRRIAKLGNNFALRDLISGAEFEISEDDAYNTDTNNEDDDAEQFNFFPNDEEYQNFDALDLDADESGVISFPRIRSKMSDLTPDGKVKKLLKRKGHGELVPDQSLVYIHYNAHHDLEPKPFDNSYLRRKHPEKYRLGEGILIPGLELGIQSMSKGEQSQFLIEPEYAYGVRGCAPRIPPNATVLFEVELVDFVKGSEEALLKSAEEEDKNSYGYAEKLAKQNHVLGNDCFKHNNEKAAVKRYEKAINILLNCRLADDDEEARQKKLLLKLYTNLSVCYNKIGRPKCVCRIAQQAVYADQQAAKQNSKLLYNWGVALVTLTEYKVAAEKLRAALKLEPNNKKIQTELSMLDKKKSQFAQEEKIYFQKALGVNSGKKEKENVPDSKTNDSISQELRDMLVEKIEEAKKGKTVKLKIAQEVIDKVEELCNSLITSDLLTDRFQGSLIISKKK